jgi:hypothetical protein
MNNVIKQSTLYFLLLNALTTFSADLEENTADITSGDRPPTSRIRLFAQNGSTTSVYKNSKCIRHTPENGDIKIGGDFSSTFRSFIGSADNTSIGMPETETTDHIKEKSSFFSKIYYREYEISANVPLTLKSAFQDVSSFYKSDGINYFSSGASCRDAISFIPQKGEDYEIAFNWHDQECHVELNQIVQQDEKVVLQPVKIYGTFECDPD